MDLLLWMFERVIGFGVASVPLILVFLMLKVFNLSPKSITICLLLNLLVSGFFWLKLKDVHIALYQGIPYVLSFIWIWVENVIIKMREKDRLKNHSSDLDKH